MPQNRNLNKKKPIVNIDNWDNRIKKEFSNPISGVASVFGIISFIVFLLSANLGTKITTIIVSFIMLLIVLPTIRFWLKNSILKIYRWFSLKFILVLIIGIVTGSTLYPLLFQPSLSSVLPVIAPKIELLDTMPENGKYLYSINSGFTIDFKKQIPWPYYNFTTVNVSPNTPVKISWSPDHQTLYIKGNKIFPYNEHGGVGNPRFEFNTTYEVKVDAPFLTKPMILKFCTPSK